MESAQRYTKIAARPKLGLLMCSPAQLPPSPPPGAASIDQDADAILPLCKTCQSCLAYAALERESADAGRFQMATLLDTVGNACEHHKSTQSWQEAIRSGCYICCRLKDLIPLSDIDECQSSVLKGDRDALFYCEINYPPEQPYNVRVTAKTYGINLAAWVIGLNEFKSTTYDVGETTNSSHAWATVLKWVEACTQKHQSCVPTDNRNTAWYPSRLIDLGSIDSQSGSIKLVDTARVKPEGNYITLSHCWGGGTPVKLKSENLSDFFLEIRSLPKTFEHAVEATRKLGVRYLWIDSLCIVQDDPSDWMREAALMHKVYRHAWCNLSATAARNSNAGLFWNRGGNTLVGPLVVDVGEPKRTLLLEADLFTAAIEHSPLQDRAWVLQERILSTRILHFSERQLFWECNELCACEAFPNGIYRGIDYGPIRTTTFASAEPTSLWRSIVRAYTKRSLTYSSDKLPALLGVANDLSPKLDGSYLAGIWQNADILHQLAWYVDLEPSKLRPRPEHMAPTWSWASVEGPIMHIEPRPDNYDPIAKIIHAEVTHVGENPAGAISHGFMLAEGPLHYVSADSRESTSKLFSAVKFDVLGEPVGDMYFLPLYSDSKDEYRDRMIANPVYHWQYLILVPWKPGSSSLKRCGLAVGGKLRSDHGVLQVGEHLGLEKGYRIRIN